MFKGFVILNYSHSTLLHLGYLPIPKLDKKLSLKWIKILLNYSYGRNASTFFKKIGQG